MTDGLVCAIQKYVERSGKKGRTLNDLYKAREYLDRWILFEEQREYESSRSNEVSWDTTEDAGKSIHPGGQRTFDR